MIQFLNRKIISSIFWQLCCFLHLYCVLNVYFVNWPKLFFKTSLTLHLRSSASVSLCCIFKYYRYNFSVFSNSKHIIKRYFLKSEYLEFLLLDIFIWDQLVCSVSLWYKYCQKVSVFCLPNCFLDICTLFVAQIYSTTSQNFILMHAQ